MPLKSASAPHAEMFCAGSRSQTLPPRYGPPMILADSMGFGSLRVIPNEPMVWRLLSFSKRQFVTVLKKDIMKYAPPPSGAVLFVNVEFFTVASNKLSKHAPPPSTCAVLFVNVVFVTVASSERSKYAPPPQYPAVFFVNVVFVTVA